MRKFFFGLVVGFGVGWLRWSDTAGDIFKTY